MWFCKGIVDRVDGDSYLLMADLVLKELFNNHCERATTMNSTGNRNGKWWGFNFNVFND